MAIKANTPNDWGMRGATNTTLPQFQGVPRQLVVNIDDGYRPVIMDGTTLGGKFKCASSDELNSGLATKLGKTDKAESAKVADKALQDHTGNNIVETYATKTEVTQGLAGKANVTGLQDALNAAIPKSGNRGALKGFENSTAGTTVNDTSPDTQHTGSNVTVQNGTTNATTSWTKVVDMTAGTVTLGSSWVWSGGKAPTLKYPGVLTCHWNGGNRKGIAIYTAGAS